jgi:hypothetical protein
MAVTKAAASVFPWAAGILTDWVEGVTFEVPPVAKDRGA